MTATETPLSVEDQHAALYKLSMAIDGAPLSPETRAALWSLLAAMSVSEEPICDPAIGGEALQAAAWGVAVTKYRGLLSAVTR